MNTKKILIEVEYDPEKVPGAITHVDLSGSWGRGQTDCAFRVLDPAKAVPDTTPPAWLWNLMREFISGFVILKVPPYYEAAAAIMDELDKYSDLFAATSPAPDEYEEVGHQYLVRSGFGNEFWYDKPHYNGSRCTATRTVYAKREKGEGCE
jgi:hypothetical protein